MGDETFGRCGCWVAQRLPLQPPTPAAENTKAVEKDQATGRGRGDERAVASATASIAQVPTMRKTLPGANPNIVIALSTPRARDAQCTFTPKSSRGVRDMGDGQLQARAGGVGCMAQAENCWRLGHGLGQHGAREPAFSRRQLLSASRPRRLTRGPSTMAVAHCTLVPGQYGSMAIV